MKKTWKPVTAGILNIIAGAGTIIALVFLILGILLFGIASQTRNGLNVPTIAPNEIIFLIFILGIPFLALSLLSIISGVFAIKRRIWGLVLAGSIGAIFCSTILGIISIVLTVVSREEFTK